MSVVEPTNVVENNEISPKYLSSNKSSPNPFNTTTIIKYNLKIASEIKVEIYNILGRKVETINEGEKPSGEHQIIWNAKDQPSGVYFYRIKAGDYSETKKMVRLK
ncbi:MAG: T9SS type A sorting domain-containing protein [candidate division Zixibacteria bacterium]|nr:T9SS type A sorting domain-containing protein [candidate division Zixibacteria bacterium]